MKLFLLSVLLPNALATGESLKIEGKILGFFGLKAFQPEAGTIRMDTVQRRSLGAYLEKFGRENRGLSKANCRYHFLINSQIERELTASYFYFRHSLFYSSIASPR
jgi:hypothetical protein